MEDICLELNINPLTFYIWWRKFSGMGVSHLKSLKDLEENWRLQQMFAEASLVSYDLKNLIEISYRA